MWVVVFVMFVVFVVFVDDTYITKFLRPLGNFLYIIRKVPHVVTCNIFIPHILLCTTLTLKLKN
jgi:hypothetical protein